MKPFLFLVLMFIALHAQSQYRGGSGDGVASTLKTSADLGASQNIYKGGSGDGVASLLKTSADLGASQNIYKGGSGDGVTSLLKASADLGASQNIYKGGSGDGVVSLLLTGADLGASQNIYKGGSGDGVTTLLKTSADLGASQNIYKGGSGDGIASLLSSAADLGASQNIYKGGPGDGHAMAFLANAVLLPVTLESFTGEWQKTDALLKWRTSSEINTSHFEIEKSTDGIQFISIGKQSAAGNSGVLKAYQFTDVNAMQNLPANKNTIYYRLRTVDKDGEYYYSAIVVLKFTPGSTKPMVLSVYPNPAKQFIVISVNAEMLQHKPVIRLISMNGTAVITKNMTALNERLELERTAAGIYMLVLIDDQGNKYTERIIKE
jgi:hypothetical protein